MQSAHPQPVLCLASTSPRRRELLMQIGVPFCLASANIDESVPSRETPMAYVQRLAREKALAVVRAGQSLPVLAADTTVVLDGQVLGKPRDRQDGIEMLQRLSAREHEVLTAIVLAGSQGSAARDNRPLTGRVSSSRVRFRPITACECSDYWDSGEPRDKAGGYAIQGLGAVFIESLQGSYSGVMGLPLFETAELLREAAIPYWHRSSPMSRLL